MEIVFSLFTMLWGMIFPSKPKEPIKGIQPLAVPDTTIGKTIPILFGSRMIKDPSIVWWGDVHIVMEEIPQGSGAKW